ncbi:MAG TPA: methyltransferase [Alphaproteobacteria bacterium]|nr:methyltransferase [Alphaproteobacteria bacterium]
MRALLRAVAETGYSFVPPTPETHRRVNARPGNAEARNLRDIFGWSRPFSAETVGEIFGLLREADALEAVGPLWKSRLRIATLGGRHYLHSAFPTDQADAVFFGPDTYRFVRSALAALPRRIFPRAVDLGCGSGAGGLAIAAGREIDALWLADINPAALALAGVNAAHAGQQARLAESNLFAALDGRFDLILANPPYMADPVGRAYRDGGGPLGLDLGLRIVSEGIGRLAPGGTLFLYTGAPIVDGIDRFRDAAEQISQGDRFNFEYSEIDPDVFGEELDNPAYREAERIAAIGLKITNQRA